MSEDFHSSFAREIKSFVVYRRMLGYSYHRAVATLKSFDRYVVAHSNRKHPLPISDLLRGWLARRGDRKAVSVAMDLGTLRQFFLYRRRFDPSGFFPGRDWAPQSTESNFVPYIFSVEQIRELLSEASRLRYDLRARPAIRALILILYCTGLRFGEAIRLEIQDVDLDSHLLRIRECKGKTRWVPFRSDLAKELRKYRQQCDLIAPVMPHSPFFARPDGKAYSVKGASGIVRSMLRRLGFKPPRGRIGPRPYDLRHSFAVHRLVAWHRAGTDVHARLPVLSAYLGHNDIMGTEVYLHATTELLELASRRLRHALNNAELP